MIKLPETCRLWTITRSSAVAKRPHDASCLSVVSFNIPTARFLPRDAMQARSLLSCSVYPSVTFVDQVKTNKHIFEIFPPSGSDTILVFPYQSGCRYSDGNPPIITLASNARGYDKMTIFHKYLALSQKRL